MAGRIRAEDIEAVRERTDIAKVVGEYLALKKAGHDSLVGLCPFHSERSPSFSVSPSKQVYYCFGCGAGGDAVRFLQEVEHLSFPETIERLARNIGYQLRYEGESPADKRAASRRQALYRANEEAANLYSSMLLDGKEATEARAYLDERGFGKDAIDRFQIGYAPGYADFLMRRLANRLSPDLLLEAGLVSKDAEGTLRDRFRGRITFPIRDLSGRHVGFGGRVLPTAQGKVAKYINTAETPIYRKSELLYNLSNAKTAATKSGVLTVVEGYTDVAALVEGGVEATVATCGTALTEEHLRLLSRFAQKVILTFDADEAGARAAERAYAFHEDAPVALVVLILPDGLDPADFIRERGSEAFMALADSARPLAEYMIRRLVERADTTTIEGRTRAVETALPVVQGLRDPIRRQQYAHLLAELTGVSDESLMAKLGRTPQPMAASRSGQSPPGKGGGRGQPGGANDGQGPSDATATATATAPGVGPRRTVQERVERDALKLLAQDPDAFALLATQLTPEHFTTPIYRELYGRLVQAKGDVRTLVGEAGDERVAKAVSQLAVEGLDGDPTADYAVGVWARLQGFELQRRSDEVRIRLQKLNPTTDPGYDELFGELIVIDGELRRLREDPEAGAAIAMNTEPSPSQ